MSTDALIKKEEEEEEKKEEKEVKKENLFDDSDEEEIVEEKVTEEEKLDEHDEKLSEIHSNGNIEDDSVPVDVSKKDRNMLDDFFDDDEEEEEGGDEGGEPTISPIVDEKRESELETVDLTSETTETTNGQEVPEKSMYVSAVVEQPTAAVASVATASSSSASASAKVDDGGKKTIKILVTDPLKREGKNYVSFKVVCKTTLASFQKQQMATYRRFSDFLGLYEKLFNKHCPHGHIVPEPPPKEYGETAKSKFSGSNTEADEFLERRRAALERFMNRLAQHPVIVQDPDFREFLEREDELPRSDHTNTMSTGFMAKTFGRGVDKLKKLNKITETDNWYVERSEALSILSQNLDRLHYAAEAIFKRRKDLSDKCSKFSVEVNQLSTIEEHTGLKRSFVSLSSCEERLGKIYGQQSTRDFYQFAEIVKDYQMLIHASKSAMEQREWNFRAWKDLENSLAKKREERAKFELAGKSDKVAMTDGLIKQLEEKVNETKDHFNRASEQLRRELDDFEKTRVVEMKQLLLDYLQALMETEHEVLKAWEGFLPSTQEIL